MAGSMKSDYPIEICHECGMKYGRRVTNNECTSWAGTCEICAVHGSVTSPRNYGHLKEEWKEIRNF